MALSEYRVGDRTYLFDEKDVPEGAELVAEEVAAEPVVLFHDQTKAEPEGDKAAGEVVDKKADVTPANKAGRKPADKQADKKPAEEKQD
jgi:hypothetical protein